MGLSEHELIKQRVEAVRARQDQEAARIHAEKLDVIKQEQKNSQTVRGVRELSPRFAIWAARHGIDSKTLAYRVKKETTLGKLWRSFVYEPPKFAVVEKHGFWQLTSTAQRFYTTSKDSEVGTVHHQVGTPLVNRQGVIIYTPTPRHPDNDEGLDWLRPPDFEPQALTDDALIGIGLRPEHIHDRIAELCVEHEIEWDIPTNVRGKPPQPQ